MTIILNQDYYFIFLLMEQLLDPKDTAFGASQVSFCQRSQNPPTRHLNSRIYKWHISVLFFCRIYGNRWSC